MNVRFPVELDSEHVRLGAIRAINRIQDVYPCEGRRGGYLCIAMRGEDGEAVILMVCLVGEVDPSKRERYLTNAIEKARRLARHKGDISSWQSRDPENNAYGESVMGDHNPMISSFSGLPEDGDQAAMVLHQRNMGWMSAARATAIFQINNDEEGGRVIQLQ